MASQSITNKLVANIKQASDVSKNYFTSTNVVCIDTSNRRIGIDTKTPTWSIDISGIESYNGVKCHNLDISGRADISYAVINFLKAPIISGDDVNISFIYVNELSGNLIDISEVVFNSISGDFIHSNNTINGEFIQCFSAIILNDLSINGTLTVNKFTFEKDVSFNEVNIDLSLTTQSSSNSLFQGTVDFSNSNPVTYRTISGNHINTFSISCDNLQVIEQADFSSINISAEASFHSINVTGEASFNTISAESIDIGGQSLQNFITETAGNNLNFTREISLNTILAKKIYIEHNDNNTTLNTNYISFNQVKHDYSNIDKLIISDSLDLSYNSETSLILPYNTVSNISDREIGHIYYSKDASGVINGIQIIKNRPNDVVPETNTPANVVTLKQTSTRFYMLKLNTDKSFINYADFSCVSMEVHDNKQQDNDNPVTSDKAQFVDIREITTDFIEINANITVSLNNDANDNGKDVDAINYNFNMIGLNSNGDSDSISDKILVSNTNTVLVFDNSYNYSSTSLHYIGKRKVIGFDDDIQYIVFGISYENVEGKTLSLNLENFHASIKSIT
tara:strand:+ start:2958 stop:4655 length:1698 start_codon:yes stop_codon:yes gene_type:complete